MTAGFDDFLSELRSQLAHSAEVASRESARPASRAAHRPWQVRPRIALAFAVGLLAPAVVVGAILISSFTTPGLEPSPQTNELLPGAEAGGSPAYVQPFVPGVGASPGTPTSAPADVSYSLQAVAARNSTSAWAVGSRVAADGRSGAHTGSFILQWNGATWRETASPDIGPLSAVAAVSNGEAWALNADAGAILHYSGGQWAAVTKGVPSGCVLNGLTVVAGNDVWAVGSQPGEPLSGPLALHWNGSSWQAADLSALAPAGGSLAAASGSSATDVWAVGADAAGARGLVLHYDGATWAPVTNADAEAADWSALHAVAAPSPTDVWTGGDALQHWDGVQWSDSPSPVAGLSGPMSVASPSDIWLTSDDRKSVVHWDGETWRAINATEMGLSADQDASLQAVAAVPGGGVWTVGTIYDVGGLTQRPLIARFDGSGWRVVVDAAQAYGEE
jgi:hypothetical protein